MLEFNYAPPHLTMLKRYRIIRFFYVRKYHYNLIISDSILSLAIFKTTLHYVIRVYRGIFIHTQMPIPEKQVTKPSYPLTIRQSCSEKHT